MGDAYAASQTTVLHMKRLNQTESPIFVNLCVLCFQRQSFLLLLRISAILGAKFSKHCGVCVFHIPGQQLLARM